MARRRRRGKPVPNGLFEARIDSLSSDARGIAHIDGKAVFIEGALPSELVSFRYRRCHSKYDEGIADHIVEASPERVEPKCQHATICGGCSLQHLETTAQIHFKQKTLLDNLRQIGHIEPSNILPPLIGDIWGYRRKARLGVRDVRAKGRVLVGFREGRNNFIADISLCEVLHPAVGQRIKSLSELIGALHARSAITQIEVAVSDDIVALVFRNMKPLDTHDHENLTEYARANDFAVYQQPGGLDTITPLWPESPVLRYRLESFGIVIEFLPSDFTQINATINSRMVDQALQQLGVEKTDHVLDLFCGLGNFTLPIATQAAQVTGVEADEGLVSRARANAVNNNLSNIAYHAADLFDDIKTQAWCQQHYDKLLLDPPRSGALEVATNIRKIRPARIVYVSCHPGTLARDAGILCGNGYRLHSVGVMDMFPHTTHIESIAVFERT